MLKSGSDPIDAAMASDPASPQELLAAENVSLRLLLTQAKLSAETLLAQAGIDAKEREAADKLQKLILEELHHRIKNTLATVGAIASQSLRHAPSTCLQCVFVLMARHKSLLRLGALRFLGTHRTILRICSINHILVMLRSLFALE